MKTLIQLGCNNGSDILDLVKTTNYDFVLLVDANPFCIEAAKEVFKDILNVQYDVSALSGEAKDVTFYIPHYEVHKTSAHSSLSKNHVLKHGHDASLMKEVQMRTITFEDLMNKYGLTSVQRLFIDCEGEDASIVSGIDFMKFRVDYIKYEHGHASIDARKRAADHLSNNGYTLELIGGDTVAVKP